MLKNNIRINQTTTEVIINVSVIANIDEILEELNEKLPKLRDFYQSSDLPIKVTGRLFTDTEKEKVKDLISSEINVNINFDEVSELLGLHAIRKTFERDTDISETKVVQYSLRCGQREEYPGSLVICGDVNSGAEVVAGGNILVLGALRGVAHAGANGNTMAIISANFIDVTQIRIANMVREVGERVDRCPICKVENNEIVIY